MKVNLPEVRVQVSMFRFYSLTIERYLDTNTNVNEIYNCCEVNSFNIVSNSATNISLLKVLIIYISPKLICHKPAILCVCTSLSPHSEY